VIESRSIEEAKMNAKTWIAGLAGGVVLFVWGSITHMLTPLGEMGIKSVPNEDAVLEVMRANITQPGLYFLPGMVSGQQNDEAAMKALEEKWVRGPAGILVYQLHGEPLSPRLLGIEFASNVVVGLLAALILAQISGSLVSRALLAGAMALIGCVDILGSYWNWYMYPTDYVLAQVVMLFVGYVLMGAVIAAIAKKQ
jgi:hypothetical protein